LVSNAEEAQFFIDRVTSLVILTGMLKMSWLVLTDVWVLAGKPAIDVAYVE
jgi:hypothetical protein